ncbi:MAG TPA: SDR family NAD(P)-dependent oxidoreductase [Bryobacteraceae bacterium]|nr:SDR family NAD(P)-dependent oxidoreductase [Bryobacteraceae bacterium]
MKLDGKVVLITGASEGIGAACAGAFRDRGAKLALVARSREKLERVAGGNALVIAGDLLERATRRVAVEQTIAAYGRIDVLVNNAGTGIYQPSHTTPMAQARTLWELNFFAPLELTQLAAADMKRRRAGAIVNVSSIAGKITLPWFTLYSASKYALNSFTDGLRIELKPWNIAAISVCPGYVRTRFQEHVLAGTPPPMQGLRDRWAVTAEQVAAAIAGAVERGVRTVLIPRSGWLMVGATRLFPGLTERVLSRGS